MNFNISIFYGSVREERQGIKGAKYLEKNLLDHFQSEYLFKPSAIASYSAGPFGGVRAAVHVRSILGELGMPAISSMLPMPGIGKLFNEELVPQNDIVEPSTNRFLDEFLWYVEALKTQREKGTPF
ncbi:MAG: NADPH-dependent FMN reductase [Bacteroidales bacterium]